MELSIKTVTTPGKGCLSFFEGIRDVPFDIRRIYYIHGVSEGTQRGGHAHRELVQLLICPAGSIEVLLDDGRRKWSVLLDEPSKGLLVEPMVWHDMRWLEGGSVLMVAASDYYDEADYIRNYGEFVQETERRSE